MRKLWLLLVLVVMLAGCTATDTYETVADDMLQSVAAIPRQIQMNLPEEAILPVMESENGQLYVCRDYDVSVQTLTGGDLSKTVREVSGFELAELTVVRTELDGYSRSEFVWAATGEQGDTVGRTAVLDDGSYHYVLTATIPADKYEAYQEIWNGMFESFCLS